MPVEGYDPDKFFCPNCWSSWDTEEERNAHTRDKHPQEWELFRYGANTPSGPRAIDKLRAAQQEGIRTGKAVAAQGNDRPAQDGPTDKQIAFLRKLRDERGISGDLPATKREASAEIERLLAMPKKKQAGAPQPQPLADVPAGYYALDTKENAKNDIAFYRVDRPDEGKWAGWTFVKRIVGGRVDERVPKNQVASILSRIEGAGISEASARYGQEIGRCGRCNRTLTNDESRQMGIGPECRRK